MSNKYDWDVSDIENSQLYDLYGIHYKLNIITVIKDLLSIRQWITKYLIEKTGFTILSEMANKEKTSEVDEYYITDKLGKSIETYEFGAEPTETTFTPVIGAPTYTIKEEPYDGWLVDPHKNVFIPLMFATTNTYLECYNAVSMLNKNFGTHDIFIRRWFSDDNRLDSDFKKVSFDDVNVNSCLKYTGVLGYNYEPEVGYVDKSRETGEFETPRYFRGTHSLFKKSDALMYPYKVTQVPNVPTSAYDDGIIGAMADGFSVQSAPSCQYILGNRGADPEQTKEENYIEIKFTDEVHIYGIHDFDYNFGTNASDYALESDVITTIDGGAPVPLSDYFYFQSDIDVNQYGYLNPLYCARIQMGGEHTLRIEVPFGYYYYLLGYTVREDLMPWWR